MLLRGTKNKSFELDIVDYQFPKIKEDYDSNWLMISIKVKGLGESWKVTDPMLLTFEVAELSQWLEDLIDNKNSSKALDFMEPNLRFVKTKNIEK